MKGLTEDDAEAEAEVISEAACSKNYPLNFDINGFKRNFATVVDILRRGVHEKGGSCAIICNQK